MRKEGMEEEQKKKKRKMGRSPCCEKGELKRGAWSAEEDKILIDYITKNGHGTWRSLPKLAGLDRCGKSCRLRWTNYLRPDIRRGNFSHEEENTIIRLHSMLGNKWAIIASHLPGRTDNEIKNFWNSRLKKRVTPGPSKQGHQPSFPLKCNFTEARSSSTHHTVQWESARLEADARLSMDSLLVTSSSPVTPECDYFLRLWNSEAGESFRKVDQYGASCQSPMSQLSSSSPKHESGSGVTIQNDAPGMLICSDTLNKQEPELQMRLKQDPEDFFVSDSTKSFALNYSFHTNTKLLLGNSSSRYTESLQESSEDEDVSIYLQDEI